MPAVYEYRLTVAPTDIDELGHANNASYLQWTQAAAAAHSAAQGWTFARYQQHHTAWIVRSHQIEYRSPAFAGDELLIATWVADLRRYSSRRRYEIRRAAPGEPTLIARAETNWVFVNTRSRQLLAIPDEVRLAFEIVDRGGQPRT